MDRNSLLKLSLKVVDQPCSNGLERPKVWCEWILQFAPAMFQGCQKPCLNRDGMHQFRWWELQIEGCYMDATVLWTLDPVACEYGGTFLCRGLWQPCLSTFFFHQCLLVSSVRVFSMLFASSGRLPAAQWTIFCGSETDLWDRGCPGSLQLELDPGLRSELWASRAQLLGIHIDYWLHLITDTVLFFKETLHNKTHPYIAACCFRPRAPHHGSHGASFQTSRWS